MFKEWSKVYLAHISEPLANNLKMPSERPRLKLYIILPDTHLAKLSIMINFRDPINAGEL